MNKDDWLWLCSLPSLGWKERMTLLQYFGSPGEARRAGLEEFEQWERLGLGWVKHLYPCLGEEFLEKTKRELARRRVSFISREEALFPEKLRALPDCPHGLFYRGGLPGKKQLSAAVVGARACSAYGKQVTAGLCRELARSGVQVISGMALGIDGAAQRAALEAGGQSFAVLGCGVDRCYPRENFDLYMKLPECGGILSEFPCQAPPLKFHFPLRNRLISGLCDILILVEARDRSGSLITADLALDQGKDIYAVPGRTQDALSYGCNRLISQGAQILFSIPELLKELCEKYPGRLEVSGADGASPGKTGKVALAPPDELVYSYLDLAPISPERLAALTGLRMGAVLSALMRLQMEDMAAEVAKNQYIRQQ